MPNDAVCLQCPELIPLTNDQIKDYQLYGRCKIDGKLTYKWKYQRYCHKKDKEDK